jgi:hypothetical protein
VVAGEADGDALAGGVKLMVGDGLVEGEMVAVGVSDVVWPGGVVASWPGAWSAAAGLLRTAGSPAPTVAATTAATPKRLRIKDDVVMRRPSSEGVCGSVPARPLPAVTTRTQPAAP